MVNTMNHLKKRGIKGGRTEHRQEIEVDYDEDRIQVTFSLKNKVSKKSTSELPISFSETGQLKNFMEDIGYSLGYLLQVEGEIGEYHDKQLQYLTKKVREAIDKGKRRAEKEL